MNQEEKPNLQEIDIKQFKSARQDQMITNKINK